jgi:hypothetical protein
VSRDFGTEEVQRTVPAYVLRDKHEWTEPERQAHIAHIRDVVNAEHTGAQSDPWVIFEYADEREPIVIWRPPSDGSHRMKGDVI